MLNPWFELLATRPQLLAAHASAWADLLAAEGGAALAGWRQRLMLQLATVAAGALGLGLAAVALMLWAVTPAAQWAQPGAGGVMAVWVLAGLPLLALGVAVVCGLAARRNLHRGASESVARLARQWQADLLLLQAQPGTA
jgi:heme exporter protein D